MSKTKVFLVYNDDDEDIVGIYDSKLKAFKKMFKDWTIEEDVDKNTLHDDYDDYMGDEEPEEMWSVYKIVLNKAIELDIDYDDGINLPGSYKDLKEYIKKEDAGALIDKLIV